MKGKRTRSAILVVSTDLSKAYDTVDHKRLLHKLKDQFLMSESALALLRAYLTDRLQSTHIGKAKSALRPITHGIPQGSSLSTTLWLMYVNDLFRAVQHSNIVAFADDNTIILAADNATALATLARAEFHCVTEYMLANRLALHPTKTKYMIVNAPTLPSLPLRAGTQLITQASSVRVLGVLLDRKLSHAATVGLRIKSLHPIVQQIRYARQYLTTPELKKLYLEQAYPRILHSITIWGSENPSKGYLRPLIKIQKRLVRHIAKVGHRAPTRQLFTDLNILTVPYLYVHRLCTDMHSYITQKPSSARHATAHIHPYQAA